ncbi:MAG TPA: DUF1127 domain-containing protein [Stellaceae bacterium]|nr:DUF1127 domain-containing protein [Stellaceae bacterium]
MYDVFITLRNAAGRLVAWRERQRVINELHALDDRSLADIGLSRGDIAYVFDAPAQIASIGAPAQTAPANVNIRHAA